MKIALYVVGGLLILSGAIWLLQSLSLLPGTYMRGNPQWSVNGSIAMVIGAILVYLARRRK